ncbi:hypothetical protein QRQ56_23340 [Bradyrhizobium sp. U531]|uniref:hypothetical protein n=1 Tax=Bradyrhizobium sp. U531 TaxID=3053458 RepID=UPI003F43D603
MPDPANVNLLSQNALARAAARRAVKQRTLTEIKSLARTHTALAMRTLVQIMRDKEAPAHARVAAASLIFDRGWGKALQPAKTASPWSLFTASSGLSFTPATT